MATHTVYVSTVAYYVYLTTLHLFLYYFFILFYIVCMSIVVITVLTTYLSFFSLYVSILYTGVMPKCVLAQLHISKLSFY